MGEVLGGESVIRMVSEKIDITFGKKKSKVHCRFVFRSTKEGADATQVVGFPDMVNQMDVGSILSMKTWIDGKRVESKKETGWFLEDDANPRGGTGTPPNPDLSNEAIFHTVNGVFPPDKDVVIEREYEFQNGGSVMGGTTFYYTTLTGAIWQGNIGRAEFNVTLEGWTIDDLAFEDGPQKIAPRKQSEFCSVNKADWTIVSPTQMKLVWENFEPAVHKSRRDIFITTWRGNAE